MSEHATSRRAWRRPVARVTLLLVALALTAFVLITPRTAEWFLFLPDASDPGSPPALAGVQGTNVKLTAEDGVGLHGWWWSAGEAAPAVVFFHGNAGNIAGRTGTAEGLLRQGLSVLLLEYRGYGGSDGAPSEDGIVADGRAALEWVVAQVGGRSRVVLHGRSLGGFVAARVALDEEPAGLVLESTFTTLEEIAAQVYPWLPRFLFRRLRGHYDARAAAGELHVPVLVVHGTADALVPVEMGRELRDRSGAEWVPVPGAGHNDLPLVGGPAYFQRLARFVKEVTAVSPGPDEPGR